MWGGHDHVSEMLLVLLVLPYFFTPDTSGTLICPTMPTLCLRMMK